MSENIKISKQISFVVKKIAQTHFTSKTFDKKKIDKAIDLVWDKCYKQLQFVRT